MFLSSKSECQGTRLLSIFKGIDLFLVMQILCQISLKYSIK